MVVGALGFFLVDATVLFGEEQLLTRMSLSPVSKMNRDVCMMCKVTP